MIKYLFPFTSVVRLGLLAHGLISSFLLSSPAAYALEARKTSGEVPASYACPTKATVDSELGTLLTAAGIKYRVIQLDPETLSQNVGSRRSVTFPLLDQKERIQIWRGTAKSNLVRAQAVTSGVLRSVTSTESLALPSAATYKFGCSLKNESCGVLNFHRGLGETHFEGLFISNDLGAAAIESVDNLKLNFGVSNSTHSTCAIIYNAASFVAADIDDEPASNKSVSTRTKGFISAQGAMLTKTLQVHLEAEGNFFSLDSTTAWSRMESVMAGANIIYSYVEPYSSGKYKLTLRAAHFGGWVVGTGPVSRNISNNLEEFLDPGYPLDMPKNHLAYLFVGYDFDSGYAGLAGSICEERDDGYGEDAALQRTRAVGQQVLDVDGNYQFATFYGRVIVLGHELGHIIGGRHEDGLRNGGAGGRLRNIRGCSLMKSGAAGGVAPDFRKPYVSNGNRNDSNILACFEHAAR